MNKTVGTLGISNKIDSWGLRNVTVVYYVDPARLNTVFTGASSGAAFPKNFITAIVKNNIRTAINAQINARLKKDKVRILFRNRKGKQDELGPIRKIEVASAFNIFDQDKISECEIIEWGINVSHNQKLLNNASGYSGNETSIALGVGGFDATITTAINRNLPWNLNSMTTNVVLHESFFHAIAGYVDEGFLNWNSSTTGNINHPKLTPTTVNVIGTFSKYVIDEIIENLEIE